MLHTYIPLLTTIVCNIDAFVAYYRATMDSSFIPKLHMLEEHVAPFIRQWRVGLGMLINFHSSCGVLYDSTFKFFSRHKMCVYC